jgi:hypothetical protein
MGGVYCENNDVAILDSIDPAAGPKLGDSTRQNGAMPYAVDPQVADQL